MKVSIAQLRAIGLSDTEILNLIETSDSEAEATARERNRIRQRNHRARNASHSDTCDKRDIGSPSLSPPSMVSPITPSLTTPPNPSPSEDTANAVSSSSPNKYAFESGVIRLSEKDFKLWETSFSNLDLRAELLALQEWAAAQPKWFFAVSGALAKRNREMKLRKEKPDVETDKQRHKREYREGLAALRAFGEGRSGGDFGGEAIRLLPGAGSGGGLKDISGGSS